MAQLSPYATPAANSATLPHGAVIPRAASNESGSITPHNPAVSLPQIPPQLHAAAAPPGPFQQGRPSPPSHSQMQPPTQQVNSHQGQAIAQAYPNGFRSPTGAQNIQNSEPQFSEQYRALSGCINNTSPDIVRHVIRDHWQRTLLGSQYHTAFLLNATINHASAEVLSRAVQDFGAQMIKDAKEHVVRHLSTQDFDLLADQIISKASNAFLDKVLAKRFETIPARHLVNALARAERLGYDVQDIVEEENGGEHVIPSMHNLGIGNHAVLPPQTPVPPGSLTQKPAVSMPLQQQPQQQQQPRQQNQYRQPAEKKLGPHGIVFCDVCDWPCSGSMAVDYHIKKNACGKVTKYDRIGKDVCPHCGCPYSGPAGLQYHLAGKVCGSYSDAAKTATASLIQERKDMKDKMAANHANIGLQASPYSSPAPQAQPTAYQPHSQSVASTPQPSSPSGYGTPSRDPYSHLSPEKRQQFEQEMSVAEAYYGALMRDAMKLPQPEQERHLASLKNRYNTKQSMTRKKYGIRLRERRSKAQIDAERTRLFGSPDGPSLSGQDGPPIKKVKPSPLGSQPEGAPQPNGQADSPRKRIPVTQMGGLSGSSATAELTDPTTLLKSSQPRSLPLPSAPHPSPGRAQSNTMPQRGFGQGQGQADSGPSPGIQAEHMVIDDDTMSSNTDTDSDSDSDNDIPAK